MSSRTRAFEAVEGKPDGGDGATDDAVVADVETSRSNVQLHVRVPSGRSGGRQWIDHTVNLTSPPLGGHVHFEVAGHSVDYTVRRGSAAAGEDEESSGGRHEGDASSSEPRGDGSNPTSEGETIRSVTIHEDAGVDGDSKKHRAERGAPQAPLEGRGARGSTFSKKSKRRRRVIEDDSDDEGEESEGELVSVKPQGGTIKDEHEVHEGTVALRASKEKETTDRSSTVVGEASLDELVDRGRANESDAETTRNTRDAPSSHEDAVIGDARDKNLLALSSNTSTEHYGGKCDVCRNKDHFFGHQLQKCADCGVLVHEACYGLLQSPDQSKLHGWLCWPCRWKDRQPNGERATVCVLCTEAGGIHALHPLYDKEGESGKQLVRRSGPAWVHTLCAMFLGSFRHTRGCVFACDVDGNYSEESVPPNIDDGGGDSTKAANSSSEVHHFVICNAYDPNHAEWYKIIKQFRSQLRCSICKKKDSEGNVLRIAVQCCTNDKDESVLFKTCHPPNKVCATAMHVGCARWKNTGTRNLRKTVYFWPGTTWQEQKEGLGDQAGDPIAEIYCIPCSQDVAKGLSTPKTNLDESSGSRKENDPISSRELPEVEALPENAGSLDNVGSGGGEARAEASREEDDTSQRQNQEQNAPIGDNTYATLDDKGKYQFRYSDGEYYSGRLVRSTSGPWVFECRAKGENFDIPMPELEEEWPELLDSKIILPGWPAEASVSGVSNKGTKRGRPRGRRGRKSGDSRHAKKGSAAKRPVNHDADDEYDSKSEPDRGNKRTRINKHSNAHTSSLSGQCRDKELTILSRSGEENFRFSIGDPAAVTLCTRLCTHSSQQKRMFDGFFPTDIAYQGKLTVRQMNTFILEKRSTKNSVIDVLRLKCSTTGAYMEAYKTFYKTFEAADRIAMCCVDDGTKLFLVTPKFLSEVTYLGNERIERNNKSTYVIIVSSKKKKKKG